MDTATAWREETNRTNQRVLCGLGLLVGGLLTYAGRPWAGHGGDRTPAFALGVLVFAVCLGGVASGGASVEIDPARRTITSERRGPLATKRVVVPFDDVVSVHVTTVAGHHGGTPAWYVSVRRRSGGTVALYLGFFDGQFSRTAMEARRRRIDALLGN